jgi:hypothetical protein
VNKSVSPTKPRRLRSRRGIYHKYLITPAECVGAGAPDKRPWAICHTTLLCLRCKLCAYHRSCAAKLPPVAQPERRKPGKADPDQLALCERPDLHYAA